MGPDIEEFTHRGMKIYINYDDDSPPPREDGDPGKILYTSTRYGLGDERVDISEIEKVKKADVIWLPVYAYIHSSIALNTTGFNCQWDSGQCGIVYACRKDLLTVFNRKRMSPKLIKKSKTFLSDLVCIHSAWISGEVYCWHVHDMRYQTEETEAVDAAYGYYDIEICKSDAIDAANYRSPTVVDITKTLKRISNGKR